MGTTRIHAENSNLLRRVADGDKQAMGECVDRYGGLVWSLARSFTRSQADAEDATQDVFVHLWRKAGQYDPLLGEEVQFVSVVARRRLIDWVRSRTQDEGRLRALVGVERATLGPARADLDEEAHAAWTALSQLVSEQRAVVLLSIVHGLTHEQISRHLQVPLGTVKTNLYRGLAIVRGVAARGGAEGAAGSGAGVGNVAGSGVAGGQPAGRIA